jgi:hypothetical protein
MTTRPGREAEARRPGARRPRRRGAAEVLGACGFGQAGASGLAFGACGFGQAGASGLAFGACGFGQAEASGLAFGACAFGHVSRDTSEVPA